MEPPPGFSAAVREASVGTGQDLLHFSLEEAALAVRYGAAALGLVGHMPSGPGVIGDDLIAGIAAAGAEQS